MFMKLIKKINSIATITPAKIAFLCIPINILLVKHYTINNTRNSFEFFSSIFLCYLCGFIMTACLHKLRYSFCINNRHFRAVSITPSGVLVQELTLTCFPNHVIRIVHVHTMKVIQLLIQLGKTMEILRNIEVMTVNLTERQFVTEL